MKALLPLLLFCISACATEPKSQPNPSTATFPVEFDVLEDRHYYLLEKDYQCMPPVTADKKKVRTFKDHIYFKNGNVFMAGDGCNDAIVAHRFNPEQFKFTKDLKWLNYGGRWYEFQKFVPQFNN